MYVLKHVRKKKNIYICICNWKIDTMNIAYLFLLNNIYYRPPKLKMNSKLNIDILIYIYIYYRRLYILVNGNLEGKKNNILIFIKINIIQLIYITKQKKTIIKSIQSITFYY